MSMPIPEPHAVVKIVSVAVLVLAGLSGSTLGGAASAAPIQSRIAMGAAGAKALRAPAARSRHVDLSSGVRSLRSLEKLRSWTGLSRSAVSLASNGRLVSHALDLQRAYAHASPAMGARLGRLLRGHATPSRRLWNLWKRTSRVPDGNLVTIRAKVTPQQGCDLRRDFVELVHAQARTWDDEVHQRAVFAAASTPTEEVRCVTARHSAHLKESEYLPGVPLHRLRPDRILPAADTPENLVVTSAGDGISTLSSCPTSGSAGYTLRCAILQANQDCATVEVPTGSPVPGCDTITFDIPQGSAGCGSPGTINGRSVFVCTIDIGTNGSLPLTASNTTVDGYGSVSGNPAPGTPSGCTGACGASANTNPIIGGSGDNAVLAIRIDGAGAAAGTNGIQLSGSYDTIRGLEITNFPVDTSQTYPQTGGDGIQMTGGACPGAPSPVTGASEAGTTVTITFAARSTPPSVNSFSYVIVSGMQPDAYNGTFKITASTTTSLSYTDAVSGLGSPTVLGTWQLDSSLSGTCHNAIAGDFIGIFQTSSAATAAGNGGVGVDVVNTGSFPISDRVGGTDPADADVISDNGLGGGSDATGGVQFAATASSTVEGNLIGTSPSGTTAMGNEDGVVLQNENTSTGNFGQSRAIVGGTIPGAGNVISGNVDDGVWDNAAVGPDFVLGNYIGTDPTGKVAVPNVANGAECNPCVLGNVSESSPSSMVVGGTFLSGGSPIVGTGVPGAPNCNTSVAPCLGNLISGNGNLGVLTASGTVQGNLIGTDITGANALANDRGVRAGGDALIGSTTPGLGNVISGNGFSACGGSGQPACADAALSLTGSTSQFPDVVQGNYIGTDITGENALPNIATAGVQIGTSGYGFAGSIDLEVDNTEIGPGNVISGNLATAAGILMYCAANTVIHGNNVGVDAGGTNPLGNLSDGIYSYCPQDTDIGGTVVDHDNVIGGSTPADRNIIGANGASLLSELLGFPGNAIEIFDGVHDVIEGNSIGTDATGTVNLGNRGRGVLVYCTAVFGTCTTPPANNGYTEPTAFVVGGTDPGASNLIEYNASRGVQVGAGSTGGSQHRGRAAERDARERRGN